MTENLSLPGGTERRVASTYAREIEMTGMGDFPADSIDAGSFFDRAITGLLLTDASATITAANETVARLLELDEDPVGSDLRAIDPVAGPDLESAVEAVERSGSVVETETTLDRGRTLELRAVPAGEDTVALLLRDASDRVATRRKLQRSNRILETLEDGVYTLDEAFVITSVNDAVTSMTGYDREELVGSHASMLAGEETLAMAGEIIERLRGDDSDVGMIESSIRTADGDSLPIETHFSSVEFANGRQERVGVIRDVTDRKQNEHALRELNRSARLLLGAADERAVYRTIVDAATSVWPSATVVAYSLDRSASVLEPVAASTDDPEVCPPGSTVWKAFSTGDGLDDPAERTEVATDHTTVDPTEHATGGPADPTAAEPSDRPPSFHRIGPGSVDEREADDAGTSPQGHVIERSDGTESSGTRTLYATLDEYGLLRIEFSDEDPAGNVAESVELLAANAVAALGRVDREAELSKHRETLSERTRQLQRLHGYNDLLRRINGALVEADTLEGIATAVCGPLVEAESVSFAWIGETYRTGGDPRPVASAGAGEGYLDALSAAAGSNDVPAGRSDREPSHRALDTGSLVHVPDVSDGLRGSPWRERALVRGFGSVLSVPLSHDDLEYGVLSVYADERGAFEGALCELLAELGDTVADAINSVETRRSLQSGSVVELEVRIDGPNAVLPRIASALDEPISVDGGVRQADGRSLLYFTTEADPTALPESVHAVESVRSLDGDADGRVEASVAATTVVDRLTAHGGSVARLVADAGGFDATVTLPPAVDVRTVVESLADRYESVELLARSDREADGDAVAGSTVGPDALTDRQREAARTAYLGGYFEWPRGSTGEDVAAAMGITQPTFNRHLRTAERKLFAALFDAPADE
jgi:PAS domain S-box-containing protein